MDSNYQIEEVVGRLLWLGVAASGVLFVAGLAFWLLTPPGGSLQADGKALISIGVAVLLLTPVARVGLLLAHYLHLRDWDFVAITLFVLAMMTIGYFGGAG